MLEQRSKGDAIPDRQAGLPSRGYFGCGSAHHPRLSIRARDPGNEFMDHEVSGMDRTGMRQQWDSKTVGVKTMSVQRRSYAVQDQTKG